VNDVISVAESDALHHLIYKLPQTAGVNPSIILFEDLKQVLLNVFEHKIQAALPTSVTFVFVLPLKRLFKKDNVIMFKHP